MRAFYIKYQDQNLEELFQGDSLFEQIYHFMNIEYFRWDCKRSWDFFIDDALVDALAPFGLEYTLEITRQRGSTTYDIYVYRRTVVVEMSLYDLSLFI